MAPATRPGYFALTLLFKEVALDDLIHGLDFLLLEFHGGDAGVELIQELAEGRIRRSTESQLDQRPHLVPLESISRLPAPWAPPIPGSPQ